MFLMSKNFGTSKLSTKRSETRNSKLGAIDALNLASW